MKLNAEILQYIEEHRQEAFDLLVELAQIPAPSNHEEKRAAFIKEWLEKQGAEGVYIDEALNVIWPVGYTESDAVAVYMAHTDVVFPDMEPLPLKIEDGWICCPGVGDDTANVVALLMVCKYIAEQKIVPKEKGLLLVANSGEEGLGNLKGSRKIVEDFGKQIAEFTSFDGGGNFGVDKAVGSKRYKVSVHTEGGHSYSRFGNRNAIAYLASLINTLYDLKVPEKGKTTYNVGTISGGISVNTIAQYAEMLYEFRSDELESLQQMEAHFMAAVEYYRTKGIRVDVELVGDRPCAANVDPVKQKELQDRAAAVVKEYYGQEMKFVSGSTDCNIPFSVGIPSVCYGCYEGKGGHTREEAVKIDSLHAGLKIAFASILYHF